VLLIKAVVLIKESVKGDNGELSDVGFDVVVKFFETRRLMARTESAVIMTSVIF
jgi:hypothetical protein